MKKRDNFFDEIEEYVESKYSNSMFYEDIEKIIDKRKKDLIQEILKYLELDI